MGGSKGGGGPAGTTTSTTDTSPWGPQQPYLEKVFRDAEGLYEGAAPQYFPGTTYQPGNFGQRAGTEGLIHTGGHDPTGQMAAQANFEIARGDSLYRNPANAIFGSLASTDSPEAAALRSYTSGDRLGGAGNPYTDALTSSVLSRVVPGIQAGFIKGGTLSSPEAARATASGATSALAPLLFQQQQQEEQNQINAAKQLGELRSNAAGGLSTSFTSGMNDILRSLALAPTTQDMLYKPYREMLQGGTAQQQLDQQAINDAVARWNWGQELPYQRFNTYVGGVTGNYGGSAVANTPYFDPPSPSPLSQVGQGIGTAATLFGMFSDRRLKDDIKTVGKLDNGLKVYSYRYKDDPEEMRRIGLMADEVEDVNPEAVMTLPSGPAFGSLGGMKMVDYARATE